VFLLIADRIQVSRMHAIVYCLLLAVASEVLQRHSFSRNPQLADLFLDGLGIAIALAIYTFFTAKRQSP